MKSVSHTFQSNKTNCEIGSSQGAFHRAPTWPIAAALLLSAAMAGCSVAPQEDAASESSAFAIGVPDTVRVTSSPGATSAIVHWAGTAGGYIVQAESGASSGQLSWDTSSTTLTGVPDALHTRFRVCGTVQGAQACSAWQLPNDNTAATWFDITTAELTATQWGFSSVETVRWAQASRAAYSFCTSLGYVGGQLNGWQSPTTVGAVCYGGKEVDTLFANPHLGYTSWGFDDTNTVLWAQASRAATDVCKWVNNSEGQFNGNESGGYFGLVCYTKAAWFDLPKSEIATTTPIANADYVGWAYAARVAHDACKRRGFVGGRLNGYQSDTTLGLDCY
jgi:hypothetical protein